LFAFDTEFIAKFIEFNLRSDILRSFSFKINGKIPVKGANIRLAGLILSLTATNLPLCYIALVELRTLMGEALARLR
jgi:hypothetical protein